MKIKFLGGARTVTGSCFYLSHGDVRILVECGMHQGQDADAVNRAAFEFDPSEISCLFLTHSHLDHIGLVPRLVKEGFKGEIITTSAAADIIELILYDSAHIQESDSEWHNRKALQSGEQPIEPLYSRKDVLMVLPLIERKKYNVMERLCKGIRYRFVDAGHILGSATLELWYQDGQGEKKIVFSGDIGRPAQLLMEDPSIIDAADFLFVESTYGDRDHKNEDDSLNELAEAIAYSYGNREKVIIPAFAVERTQEIMYCLYLLARDGRLPQDMPVYLDSPLAIQATEIFRHHTAYLDEETRELIKKGDDPLHLPQLRFTPTTDESIAINTKSEPAIVISASGMADAGRIKHHLRHNIWREGASIVFVGFQAQGTTGRKIIDGAKKIRLFNEEIAVKARIFTINGFSAHAGQSQILEWLSHFKTRDMQVFLVHGEFSAQQTLAGLIKERFGFKVLIPDYLEETTLESGRVLKRVEYPEKATPGIDWDYIIGDIESRFARLKERKSSLVSKPWVEQTELRDRLLELDRVLIEINSEV